MGAAQAANKEPLSWQMGYFCLWRGLSGETNEQAAHRETLEEMGIEVELHHVESFLNVFPGDNGEERKWLSHLYVGISDEQPQANNEVDEFKQWEPNELRADVKAHPDAYVPSFIVELDKAIKGFKGMRK